MNADGRRYILFIVAWDEEPGAEKIYFLRLSGTLIPWPQAKAPWAFHDDQRWKPSVFICVHLW